MEVQEGAGERRMELSAAAALCASGGTAQGKQRRQGSMVKRLRHRPFTAVTRVRFPLESFFEIVCHIIEYRIWRSSQAVRRGSATP